MAWRTIAYVLFEAVPIFKAGEPPHIGIARNFRDNRCGANFGNAQIGLGQCNSAVFGQKIDGTVDNYDIEGATGGSDGTTGGQPKRRAEPDLVDFRHAHPTKANAGGREFDVPRQNKTFFGAQQFAVSDALGRSLPKNHGCHQ